VIGVKHHLNPYNFWNEICQSVNMFLRAFEAFLCLRRDGYRRHPENGIFSMISDPVSDFLGCLVRAGPR